VRERESEHSRILIYIRALNLFLKKSIFSPVYFEVGEGPSNIPVHPPLVIHRSELMRKILMTNYNNLDNVKIPVKGRDLYSLDFSRYILLQVPIKFFKNKRVKISLYFV
jgi:hypothetical protein